MNNILNNMKLEVFFSILLFIRNYDVLNKINKRLKDFHLNIMQI